MASTVKSLIAALALSCALCGPAAAQEAEEAAQTVTLAADQVTVARDGVLIAEGDVDIYVEGRRPAGQPRGL